MLGNLYLRVTSAKIQSRIEDQERPSIQDLAASEVGSKLFSLVKNLAGTVKSDMDKLQVADALDAIVLALQEVS